ncbi:MAG: hypothetical protein K0Q74_1157, partial [Gammaproteobacteria bacterium]|nr:hypothetical protein [Gammaproteobacteria bacterium]
MPKPLKPHKLQSLISIYQELIDNPHYINSLVEFVAKYRFFTLQQSTILSNEIFYNDLYRMYITPLIEKLRDKHVSDTIFQEKFKCLETILDLMIKNPEHNDNWSISLLIAVYRKSFFSSLTYRNLSEELTTHNLNHMGHKKKRAAVTSTNLNSDTGDIPINVPFLFISFVVSLLLTYEIGKRCSSEVQPYLSLYLIPSLTIFLSAISHLNLFKKEEVVGSIVLDITERHTYTDRYIKKHMPKTFDFSSFYIRGTFIVISLIISVWLNNEILKRSSSEAQPYLSIYLIPSLTIFLTMISQAGLNLVNMPLRSHLTFDGLPAQLRGGLLSEIYEHINDQIALYDSQMPERFALQQPPSAAATRYAMPPLKMSANSGSDDNKNNEEVDEAKAPKRKTRSTSPSLSYLKLNAALNLEPTCRWNTRDYGEIFFQVGRVNDDLIPLWSGDKKLCNRYVVLFPREQLEQKEDRKMITAFWKTACFGRIVHEKNEVGFVPVTNQEKRNTDHALLKQSIFKLKTLHKEYAGHRMPVTLCETEGENNIGENNTNGMELLVAQAP